jgi:hypothetical protein
VVIQAQTPQQRQANMRFAKAQEKKMGKPEAPVVVKPRGPQKSPISKGWIGTFLPYNTTQHNPIQYNPVQSNPRKDWRGTGEGLEREWRG